MVNVESKKCLNCNKQPKFNFAGSTNGIYCFDHKKPNMVNVECKRCLKCNKQPNYNFAGQKNALYCFIHKDHENPIWVW
jgi:hypothetical protein